MTQTQVHVYESVRKRVCALRFLISFHLQSVKSIDTDNMEVREKKDKRKYSSLKMEKRKKNKSISLIV